MQALLRRPAMHTCSTMHGVFLACLLAVPSDLIRTCRHTNGMGIGGRYITCRCCNCVLWTCPSCQGLGYGIPPHLFGNAQARGVTFLHRHSTPCIPAYAWLWLKDRRGIGIERENRCSHRGPPHPAPLPCIQQQHYGACKGGQWHSQGGSAAAERCDGRPHAQ